jgi:hypothetical protein
MANKVFANGREISCKAGSGKSICAFPDVCFTPPQTPATPPGVPIPYPNTGMSSDMTDGSKNVKISGKEIMLKNKSYFKKSTGDEAGAAPKKGVVTSKNTGKVYFNAWSMDVKFEGENVVRHLDLTTHNHGSVPGNSPTWPYIDEASIPAELKEKCAEDRAKEETACNEYKPHGSKDACAELAGTKPVIGKGESKGFVKTAKADPLADEVAVHKCLEARRCGLQPYKPSGCCPPQTPHHLIEGSALFSIRAGKKGASALASFPNGSLGSGTAPYNVNKAPCVCAEGVGHDAGGTHELMHTLQSASAMRQPQKPLALSNGTTMNSRAWSYKEAKKSATDAFATVFKQSGCSEECLNAQLDAYHRQCGINDSTEIKAVATSDISPEELAEAIAEAEARNSMALLEKLLGATDTDVAWFG